MIKRKLRLFLRLAFLPIMLLVFGLTLIQPQAATGEGYTFTWLDKTTIRVSGGELESDLLVRLQLVTSDDGTEYFAAGQTDTDVTSDLRAVFNTSDSSNGCSMNYTFKLQFSGAPVYGDYNYAFWKADTVSRNITVSVDPNPPDSVSAPGTAPIDCEASDDHPEDDFPSSATLTNDWPGKTGGGTPEDPAYRIIDVSVSVGYDTAPEQLEIVVRKNAPGGVAGEKVAALTATREPGRGDLGDGKIEKFYYHLVFQNIDPGDYHVIAPALDNAWTFFGRAAYSPPQPVTIEHYKPPKESEEARRLWVNIDIDTGGGIFNVDVDKKFLVLLPMVLLNADTEVEVQKVVAHIEYDPEWCNYPNGDPRPQCRLRLEGRAKFENVKPGKYKACTKDLEYCAHVKTDTCDTFSNDDLPDCSFVIVKEKYEPHYDSYLSMRQEQAAKYVGNGQLIGEDACPINEKSKLRWIICPLVEIGDATIGWLEGVIQWFLYTPTDVIFDGIKDSTAGFRNIGLSLLAIAALVMIVSQAMGIEIFDAYTIKKIMPRLLIAAIGIAIAAPVLQFVIGFFNDLGLLIDSVVRDSIKTSTPGATSAAFGPTGAGVGVVAAAAVGVVVAGLGILSIMGTVVLALLIGMLVLAIRQMVIMVCVLFAPIAIAAYILPGTQKLWAFWKNALMTSLIMFPIIMAFIASGEALSRLLGGTSNPQMQMLALIVRYAPFFLLPFAFKLAGGLMATVFSLANDSSRGGFDRLKNFRQAKAAQSISQMKAGNRFSERNALTRKFNRASAGTFAAGRAGVSTGFGLTKRGREQVKQGIGQQLQVAAAEGVMKSPAWTTINEYDEALRAATYGSVKEAKQGLVARSDRMSHQKLTEQLRSGEITQEEFDTKYATAQANNRQSADEAVAAAKQSIGFGRAQAVAASQQLATTGTGYADMKDMATTIGRASGGNESTLASIVGNSEFISKYKGRTDLAATFDEVYDLASREAGLSDKDVPTDDEYNDAVFKATGAMDAMTTMRNKAGGFANTVKGLQHGLGSSDAETVKAAKSRVNELINVMSYGPQPNQNELIKAFKGTEFEAHIQSAMKEQREGRTLEDRERGLPSD